MTLNWIWFWAFEDWTLSLSWQMFLSVLLISHREYTWHVSCPHTCLLTLKWSVFTPRQVTGDVFWLLPVQDVVNMMHKCFALHSLLPSSHEKVWMSPCFSQRAGVINCTWDGNRWPPAINPQHGALYFPGTFPLLRAPLKAPYDIPNSKYKWALCYSRKIDH